MITKRWSTILILALVLSLLAVPAVASAKATVKHCIGTEILLELLDPGVWTFPNGNIHVRGMTSLYEEVMDCPEVSGINTVIMNANWDENYAGPIWGTSILETPSDGGGVWHTTWHGKTFADGTFYYKGVGRGVSGSVEGLKLRIYAYANPDGSTTAEIVVLDPHGD